jgi:hypothetical protein
MRPLSSLLLATVVLQLWPPTGAFAAPTVPCQQPCQSGGTSSAREAQREQEADELRREHERIRFQQAERIRAQQEAAIQAQRMLEREQEESVAETRKRVGKMGLALAGTTGCLTALSVYLGRKGTETGQRSYWPITQGLAGFTVATGLLGTGFLLSGLWSNPHDLTLGVVPGRRPLATLGWRFY